MTDYTVFVLAVYGLATVVYGGLTLLYQRAYRRAEAKLRQEIP